MKIEDLDYKIPRELIALYPKKPRDESDLIITGKNLKKLKFKELVNELKPNDALIFNNTKVIKAYLEGTVNEKKISINLNKLENKKKNIWSSFIKSKEKIKKNDKIIFFKAFHAIVDSLKDYEKGHPYFGALTGRVAGRIGNGKFCIVPS